MKPTSILILGPPKTGKTTFAASVADIVPKTLVLTLRPKEADSFGYTTRSDRIDVEIINDPLWLPSLVPPDKLKSTAFEQILRRIVGLFDDTTYDAVIIDPLTDVFIAAGRSVMAEVGVSNPQDMPGKGTIQYYGDMGRDARFFIQRLVMLTTAKKPKWVIATQHTKPASEEDLNKQKSADKRAQGIRFEGEVLPQMEGSYRYDLGGEFAVQLFSTVKIHYSNPPEYSIQVTPDRERHAAVGVAPMFSEKTLPNNMVEFVKCVDRKLNR